MAGRIEIITQGSFLWKQLVPLYACLHTLISEVIIIISYFLRKLTPHLGIRGER